MVFLKRFQKQLNIEDPQQLKRECRWLWSRVKKYRDAIVLVGFFTLLGTLMMSIISNVLALFSVSADVQLLIVGFVLILAVAVDEFTRRKESL